MTKDMFMKWFLEVCNQEYNGSFKTLRERVVYSYLILP